MVPSPCADSTLGLSIAPSSGGRGLFFGPLFTRSLLARSAASPLVEVAPTTVNATVVRHAGHMGSSSHELVDRSGPRSTWRRKRSFGRRPPQKSWLRIRSSPSSRLEVDRGPEASVHVKG